MIVLLRGRQVQRWSSQGLWIFTCVLPECGTVLVAQQESQAWRCLVVLVVCTRVVEVWSSLVRHGLFAEAALRKCAEPGSLRVTLASSQSGRIRAVVNIDSNLCVAVGAAWWNLFVVSPALCGSCHGSVKLQRPLRSNSLPNNAHTMFRSSGETAMPHIVTDLMAQEQVSAPSPDSHILRL